MNAIEKTEVKISRKEIISKFKNVFSGGIEKIVEAATIYVHALESGELTHDDFFEAVPGIPPTAWHGLEAVGRGWLDRRLLWGGGRAASYLKKLPPSDQTNAFDNGLKMLLKGGDAILVKPELMTRKQCEQIFAENHIRSLGEQRTYIETEETSQPIKTASEAASQLSYEIKKNRLIVREPLIFTPNEIKKILRIMQNERTSKSE